MISGHRPDWTNSNLPVTCTCVSIVEVVEGNWVVSLPPINGEGKHHRLWMVGISLSKAVPGGVKVVFDTGHNLFTLIELKSGEKDIMGYGMPIPTGVSIRALVTDAKSDTELELRLYSEIGG